MTRALFAIAALLVLVPAGPSAQTDLDAFMREVVVKRDDNWKKLQQYILDEREVIELRGTNRLPIWGERREYTWFIRDGFFVRSPVKFNGAAISESERRKAEEEYLARQKRRDRRGGASPADTSPDGGDGEIADVGGLIQQTRQPQFVSSAYFLRFKFEEGKYALVGREALDGREVLRIEYYPERLFTGSDRRRNRDGKQSDKDRARDAEFQRLMNKVALVTLWVEPTAHQIVKYTFDNVGFDFLPAQWLVHINDAKATMTMGQPFPNVWLPNGVEMNMALTLAVGQYDLRYALDYYDYRQPDVTTKVGIKER
ncbi:MAG TPA: hypothetical protein VKE96_34560 [Vicinamibacterales bacterium]|nr:hypothetical protein [Vicinamibacterales bacterium]